MCLIAQRVHPSMQINVAQNEGFTYRIPGGLELLEWLGKSNTSSWPSSPPLVLNRPRENLTLGVGTPLCETLQFSGSTLHNGGQEAGDLRFWH